MQTVTLISAPGKLDGAAVSALRNAWGGGEIRVLSSSEAACFDMPEVPANRWDVWDSFQQQGVDLLVQPAGNLRRKMLLADMDSTLIQQECIDELAAEAGVGAQVADITARAMNGELEFEGALKERVALLKGLPVSIIDKVLSERITYMPGGRTLVATMKANGAFAMLVSGGFTAFAAQVADALGMDAHRANTLHVDGDVLAGTVAEPILGRDAKVESLKDRAAQLGISEADVLAVGDGANDLGMLSLAGTGVALHAKPAVQAQCDLRINHGDLTALLFLQGYARDAFVTD
ncbi:phosphoserine phosphatase SerB [Psychromarinibacter halotolerans]|uniref:Phosphoserine phosphatase n=1 Tax=Psychromarinibacter halotolerans TaxID=1775175 RepID=A0ABV7GM03_9RHOB|nr:phosphoserine phosphatase SerB [Psychromarinibacter halotolerans]MAQ85978.1 phosphoserine phosphatase SerB [Maritimibacter sp.]MDF0595840.1 phosphoserine phosphatase SerB [Psychromarinibacter halotolerans]